MSARHERADDGSLGLHPSQNPVQTGKSRGAISRDTDGGHVTKTVRHWIEGLAPYQSLLLIAIPICLVEPLKLVAVAIAGKGHWITGTAMIIGAYAASLLVVERLFTIVKPKLLMLPWFARGWSKFVVLRYRITSPFRHILAR